ncbi:MULTISPECIES: hypothetical protein [Shewanella]|uniref:hypothetical protein n=1 Tax=Shewanella TaxID=22 RepID=UPI0004AD9558|nr:MULTISPECIES: hypothetical protein [Shewanella]
MKKLSLLLATMLPGVALAHPGHDGVGLFHHMQDILPIVLAVIIVGGYMLWKKYH